MRSKTKIPSPTSYYQALFPSMRVSSNTMWASVRCCFHDDSNPSLRLNIRTGAFRCFGCGAKGGDIRLSNAALFNEFY